MKHQLKTAPANSLPDWQECALRVSNSDYIEKRIAEGGFGFEEEGYYANDIHRFIHEYDDSDPHKSAWFLHRLEKLIEFVKTEVKSEDNHERWTQVEIGNPLPDEDSPLGLDDSLNVIARWDNGDIEMARYHYVGMDEPVFQRLCGTNEGCHGWGGDVGHVTHWIRMPEDPGS